LVDEGLERAIELELLSERDRRALHRKLCLGQEQVPVAIRVEECVGLSDDGHAALLYDEVAAVQQPLLAGHVRDGCLGSGAEKPKQEDRPQNREHDQKGLLHSLFLTSSASGSARAETS
jgi:hypothetical protein